MLETFRGKVPWSHMNPGEIRAMWKKEASPETRRCVMLSVSSSAIPTKLKDVLQIGLQPKFDHRHLELDHVLWKLRGAADAESKSRRG